MKKRLLAIFLVLAMMMSVLAACTPGGDDPDITDESFAGERKDSWLCNKKTTLTVLCSEGTSTSNPPASNDLPFWAWLEDYTNVHIEWEVASSSGYTEVVSTRLSAGVDLPDIMMVNTLQLANKAGENGILVDLSEYWDDCFTNTSSYWKSKNFDFLSYTANPDDGSMYALIGVAEPVEGHITIMYNTEWMNKIGASIPTTLDEFTALLSKMQAAGDLNGNGRNDEVILTADSVSTLTSALGTAFGLEQYEAWDAFASKDGKVYDEYTSDNMKEFLSYLNKLYKAKQLDAEISSMNANTLAEKIASDRVGIFCYYSSYAITYGQLTSAGQADPFGEHYSLGLALASKYNGNKGYFMRRERALGAPTAITDECKNVELACKWLDALYADPNVLNVRQYGIENEDWYYDDNGEIVLVYPDNGSPRDISKKGCGQIPLCHFQTVEQLLEGHEQYPWYLAEYEEMRTKCEWKSPTVKHVSLYTEKENDLITFVATDVKGVYGEYRDKFIKGYSDINKDWNTYVTQINKMGLQDMVKAWQMIYDRTK